MRTFITGCIYELTETFDVHHEKPGKFDRFEKGEKFIFDGTNLKSLTDGVLLTPKLFTARKLKDIMKPIGETSHAPAKLHN